MQRWQFIFAAISAIAGIVKILEYCGINPIKKEGAGVPLTAPYSYVTLIWGAVFFILSIGLSCYGLYAVNRKRTPEVLNALVQLRLPEQRPRVEPVRFGPISPGHIQDALLISNQGDTAFEITVEPFRIGASAVEFDTIPSLPKASNAYIRGTFFLQDNVTIGTLDGILKPFAQGIFIHSIKAPVNIIYRDYSGNWYRSVCELESNIEGVRKGSGLFKACFIRQERLKNPEPKRPWILTYEWNT